MIPAWRFFAVAPLHSRYMVLALATVFASGTMMLIVNPAKGADALGPLALLQMLAASSGCEMAARRGHLDLLLTAGPGRLNVAVWHLAASIAPGMLVWCALGVVEIAAARTLAPRAFAAGSVAALCLISALAWALTVRLPRLSGGIAWLLGIAMWVVGWSGGRALADVANDLESSPFTQAVVVTLCPFVLIGRPLSGRELLAVLPAIVLAFVLVAAAMKWVVRMDVPLESAQ